MTQTQVMGHLAEKIGISKKEAKLTLEELNALVVRELKEEGGSIFTVNRPRINTSTPWHGSNSI